MGGSHLSFTNVVALLKHSDAQSSDSSQRLVFAASVQPRIYSRRMSGNSRGTPSRAACPALKAREIALSTGPFFCGVYGAINSRRIPKPSLQESTNILFEYLVPLSARETRRTPEKWRPRSFRARRTAAVDAKRYQRTSRRIATPREKLDKVQRCRCGQAPAAASLASSRDVEEWAPNSLSSENKPNIKPIPRKSRSHAVSLSLSVQLHGRGQEKHASDQCLFP